MRRAALASWIAAATTLLGCATAPPRRADVACAAVAGLQDLLSPGAVLLLGEIHGTEEGPAFLADAACQALRAGRPVRVALEVPGEEGDRVRAFLASAGRERDRAALLDGPFWRADYQDGRRSRAMLALFETLRRWTAERRPLGVELLDRAAMPADPVLRDRRMGEALARAHDAESGGVVIALLGNLHSRVTRGTPWDADYEPAGFVLARLRPGLRLTALDVAHRGGSAWFCTSAEASSCEERSLREPPSPAAAEERGLTLHPAVTDGHHGFYRVGRLTASPPARGPG